MRGHLPPLFDRFDVETPPLLNTDQFIESVKKEILLLLSNYRNDQLFDAFYQKFLGDAKETTPIDIANPHTWKKWCAETEDLVMLAEPRLHDISMTIEKITPENQCLHLKILGHVVQDNVRSHFNFLTKITNPFAS